MVAYKGESVGRADDINYILTDLTQLLTYHWFKCNTINVYTVSFQDDLLGKSVYNIIHISDHVQFSNSLLSLGELFVFVLFCCFLEHIWYHK